jgi:hypothetical protein
MSPSHSNAQTPRAGPQSGRRGPLRPPVALWLTVLGASLGLLALFVTAGAWVGASAAFARDRSERVREAPRIALLVGASESSSVAAIRAAVRGSLDAARARSRPSGAMPADVVIVTVAADASAESACESLLAEGSPQAVLVVGGSEDVQAALRATEGSGAPVMSLLPIDATIVDSDLVELAGTASQRIVPAMAWLRGHAGDRMVCVVGERVTDRASERIAADALRFGGADWHARVALSGDADPVRVRSVARAIADRHPTAIVTALEPRIARPLIAELRRLGLDGRRVPTLHLAFEETAGLDGDLCIMPHLPHEDSIERQRLRSRIAASLVDGAPVGDAAVTEAALRVDAAIRLLENAIDEAGGSDALAIAAALRRAAEHGPTGTAVVERRGGLWMYPSVIRLGSIGLHERVWTGDRVLAPGRRAVEGVLVEALDDAETERGSR